MNTQNNASAPALARHTPGPWKSGIIDGVLYVTADDRGTICDLFANDPRAEANARLIAAAPDLLANLKMMTDLAERYGAGEHCDGNVIEAREVIARAEGRT